MRGRAILPRMSAPRAIALLHRVLCLVLSLSLAAPSLGLAHAAPAAAAPAAVLEAEPPCPMHAAAEAANDAAESTADAGEIADCCQPEGAMHAGCGEDCRDCLGGCASLRLPTGLDAAAWVLASVALTCAPADACAQSRPDAPQPKLLRPPALV